MNMNGTDCHSPSTLGKLVCLVWTANNIPHYWIFFFFFLLDPCGPITPLHPTTVFKNYNLFCCLKLHSVNNKQHWWNAKSWKFVKQKDLQPVSHLCHIKHALNRSADSCLISTRGRRGPGGPSCHRPQWGRGPRGTGEEGPSPRCRRHLAASLLQSGSMCSADWQVTAAVRS